MGFRIAGLGQRRDALDTRMALSARNGQHAKPAAFDMPCRRKIRREYHIDSSGYGVSNRRREAAIGYVKKLDASLLGQ